MFDAQKMRNYVISRKIEPARRRGQNSVRVTAKEINHNALGSNTNWPNVSSAINSNKLQNQAGVHVSVVDGVEESTTTVFEITW